MKYVIGGACIFDSIGNFFARMLSSNEADLQAGKTASKDIGMKAIGGSKTVAFDSGKKLVKKAAKRLSTPNSQVANAVIPQEKITKKYAKL